MTTTVCLFAARATKELGKYASDEAIQFWALCLEAMEHAQRSSLSGTPAELASQIGYEGDAGLAVCLLHDLSSRAATVLILNDDSDALDPASALGIEYKTVLLVSSTRQTAMRQRLANRRRVAAVRNGSREAAACFPSSAAYVSQAACRPKQLPLCFGDSAQDNPQHVQRIKEPAGCLDRAGGVGNGQVPSKSLHDIPITSSGQARQGNFRQVSSPGPSGKGARNAVARTALQDPAQSDERTSDSRNYRDSPAGNAVRASALQDPHVTFNTSVLNVNVRKPETQRGRRPDDREDIGGWSLEDRHEIRRITRPAIEQFGDRINTKDFGDRRLFLGLAALVYRNVFDETQYLKVLQGAAKADKPAAYVMSSYKKIADRQYGLPFGGMLNNFKYPDVLIPEETK